MSRTYAYRCDAGACREFAIPDLGIGDVRSAGARDPGRHYCPPHYPLARCSHCDRPMRPNGSLKRDWPGAKAKGARGLCSTCYLRERNYGMLPRLTATREVRRLGDMAFIEGEGDWQLPEETASE